tara:strand:+ start:1823 stop:2347 length:525 start_codon:yes stop_codon:yes gene_type:complete
MIETIKAVIIPILIIGSLYLIKKASKKKSKIYENGNSIHRLPLIYGIGGIFSLIITIIIITSIFLSNENINLFTVASLIILFSTLGIIMILMVWMNKIYLNPKKITQRNMWGKIKTIEMSEIKSIKFNKVSLYLKISDGEKIIKCHDHLVGIEEILNTLSEKTNITRNQMGYVE